MEIDVVPVTLDFQNWQLLLEELQSSLMAQKATVATAESCTGGILAAALTALPGSSQSYQGGVAAYADHVKVDVLGILPAILTSHGAVSREVAELMAKNVKSLVRADYALSLTGIAGPGGGSPTKPVGTVFCGIAGPRGSRVKLFQLSGSRTEIRTEAARLALLELKDELR